MYDIRKITTLSVLLCISIVLSIVEGFIPIFIPGVKLGLANIVTLFVLYKYSYKDALTILVMRILLVAILRGSIFSYQFYLSLTGGALAFIAMAIAYKLKSISIIGVSVLGSVFHGVGQIVMAILLLDTNTILYYLPIVISLSIPSGILTALFTQRTLKIVNKLDYH